MKYTALLLILPLAIAACHSNETPVADTTADSTVNKKPAGFEVKQLSGVFYDTLPCADCPGIATKVYLKPDNTFVMERNYVNKGTFYETGTWATQDSALTLTGTGAPQQFKINSYAELEMLDTEGKKIDSPKPLLLRRNNIPFKPANPVPVEGVYAASGDTMTLHVCSMKKDFQATLAPTAMMMSAKYKQAAKNGGPIYAQVAGHFELRPSLNDTTTQDFFIIEKFIKFVPGQVCK